jgi:hypothetical protein
MSRPVPADNAKFTAWGYYYTLSAMLGILAGAFLSWTPEIWLFTTALFAYLMLELFAWTTRKMQEHESNN